MKVADVVLLIASLSAVALVVMARRDSKQGIASAGALASAQQNASLYGGSVSNWLNFEYIDNDPVPGIEIPGGAF